MKKSIFLLLISFFCISISSAMAKSFPIPLKDTIIGYFDFYQLEEEPYSQWYIPEYSAYEVDKTTLDSLNKSDLNDLSIIVVIGTWCHDSQRETPRFVKILEYLEFEDAIAIGVNKQKQSPGTEVPELNIEFVPTFILYKNNKEIGRIIETPLESLERDLLKIIKSNNMHH